MHINSLIHSFKVGYSSTSNNANLLPDIAKLRPTFFGSFPLFYNKIYKRIKENISDKVGFLSKIVDHAIQTKMHNYIQHGQIHHTVYDLLVLKMMRDMLGGRIRFMISGGAPLSIEVKNFLTVVYSAPIMEAYGMTEAAGSLTCSSYWDNQGNHVGGTLPCNKMQLRDVPELGLSTDDPSPRGAIYIKGNAVFKGYFKDPD